MKSMALELAMDHIHQLNFYVIIFTIHDCKMTVLTLWQTATYNCDQTYHLATHIRDMSYVKLKYNYR